MPDLPTPDSTTLPEGTTGMRSRPADVVAERPIVKGPAPAASDGSTVRPGAPPADSPTLAAIRADRVAVTTPGNAAPRELTTDQLMPTCMIYAMFAGMAILAGTVVCWMGSALSAALHLFH